MECLCHPASQCEVGRNSCSTDIDCFIRMGPIQGCVTDQLVCRTRGFRCCSTPHCNNMSLLIGESEVAETHIALMLWTGVAVVLILACVAFVLKSRRKKPCQSLTPENGSPAVERGPPEGSLQGDSVWTGSGSGGTRLTQSRWANQVTCEEVVGRGRYGVVWRGKVHGDRVAVKVFASHNEISWRQETRMYATPMLSHVNILGFVASELASRGGNTQFWLITDYHEQGSLYDYLRSHVISPAQLVAMLLSAARGLFHLHTEINTTQWLFSAGTLPHVKKPAIAHRDVKSKNILVKSDGQCCIADLGLAVTRSGYDVSCLDLNGNHRVGTRRYMAPEVIEGTLTSFEALCKADVYSFSLVCWETAARCAVDGLVAEHQLPYQDLVPSDPTIEDMRRVVCVQGLRPALPTYWPNHPLLRQLGVMMSECWRATPTSRLTMFRIKTDLFRMSEQDLDSSDDTKAS